MFLPTHVAYAISRLENAGFSAYAVGGCVRDSLLGLTPQDYDLCTNASPAETKAVFADHNLVLAGEKHGTVGVIFEKEVVEITTYRTEGEYADNRHPGWVAFVDNIEADLARRDFTVNAMAYSPTRGFADPFGGREDLKNRILRAVGDPSQRFREDSLRILRGARFAAKYRLDVDAETEKAMNELAPLTDNLAKERIFDELCKLLLCATAEDLLRFSPVLTRVIPELKPLVGFDQRSVHHAYDIYTHTAYVVENTPKELPLRWAALLHDTGRIPTFTLDETGHGHFYGHAEESAKIADAVLLRLKAPTALRQQAVTLIEKHMLKFPAEKKAVRRWYSRLGKDTFHSLLALMHADMRSKGLEKVEEKAMFRQILDLTAEIEAENACLSIKDLAVSGHDLIALGYTGPAIGQALHFLLDQVLDDHLPNEKEALISALKTR
jgi:tRNA nucleotidyltransferase (CCA-adding enzyme)